MPRGLFLCPDLLYSYLVPGHQRGISRGIWNQEFTNDIRTGNHLHWLWYRNHSHWLLHPVYDSREALSDVWEGYPPVRPFLLTSASRPYSWPLELASSQRSKFRRVTLCGLHIKLYVSCFDILGFSLNSLPML